MRPKYRLMVAAVFAIIIVASIYSFAERFSKNDELNVAALSGDLVSVKALLAKGAEVNGRGMHDMTPLMSAAKGGHTGVARFLLNKGADVNGHNDSGSVLMWAAAGGHVSTVRLLIQRKVDVNWRSAIGDTALKDAVESKQPVIVKILKQAGAKG
jgi:ankyrin repeat protein